MAMTCTVCRHPDVAQIDALLRNGESHRMVATKWHGQLTRHAIDRHAANGHVAAEAPGAETAPNPANGDNDLDSLITHLEAQLKQQPGRADLARELRIAYADRAKMRGPVVVDDGRPTWEEVRAAEAVLMTALEPFVEARKAAADALRAHLASRRDERANTGGEA